MRMRLGSILALALLTACGGGSSSPPAPVDSVPPVDPGVTPPVAVDPGTTPPVAADPGTTPPVAVEPGTTSPVTIPDAPGTQPAPLVAMLRVTDDSGGTGPMRIGKFSRFALEFQATAVRPGTHAARVNVLSPSGTVYASLPAQLQVGESGTATLSRVVQVRGTSIETYRRKGTWRFSVALDDAPVAVTEVELTE